MESNADKNVTDMTSEERLMGPNPIGAAELHDFDPVITEAGVPTADFRPGYQEPVLSTIGTIILAFALILSTWDTWSTFIDIIAPINKSILLRAVLNLCLCVISAVIISRYRGASKRMIVFGNLIGGIGIWEMTESWIETAFEGELFLKLVFYASCMIVTYSLVWYLEQTKKLNVMDSPWLSPV
jgi:hypothetical protein